MDTEFIDFCFLNRVCAFKLLHRPRNSCTNQIVVAIKLLVLCCKNGMLRDQGDVVKVLINITRSTIS